MPLYEYECSTCGHHFEVIRKFSDPPEEKCPKCGGAVRKLQSAPSFQFKGTGWYVTDYAKSGQAEGKAGAEGKADAEGKAGAEGKKNAATEASSKSDSSTSGSPTTSTTSTGTPAASGTTTSKSGD